MGVHIYLRKRRFACLACATLVLGLFGSRARARPPTSIEQARQLPLFEFHSNFWVNLHQTLFHEALLREALRAGKPDRRLQNNGLLSAVGMSAGQSAAWNAGVDSYAKSFGARRELFDDQMIGINNTLAQLPDDGDSLGRAKLPPAIAGILQSAAPIYRSYWWPAQDTANEKWISSQADRVKELGAQIAAAMEKDLRQPWPTSPVRVDVCYYVPEIGHAYTTTDPAHTTFSSSAPPLQGLDGFETLFHEASHSFADKMSDALFAECGKQKKKCGDLWHAVLFYTAGTEVRRVLPPSEQAGFVPYAYKYGLYTRGNWPAYRGVLEKDWQPYLDGKVHFGAAINSMVSDLH